MFIGLSNAITRENLDPGLRFLFANGEAGAWYDPSDLTTLFQDAAGTTPVAADGDPVGLILDKSGNGYHASQAVSASRPTYRTSGGLHWLEFDGVDDSLETASISPGSDKVQIFTGVRKLSDVGSATVVELSASAGTNDGGAVIFAPLTASANYAFGSRGTSAGIAYGISAGSYAAPITNVVSGLGDISGDLSTLRVNGVQASQSTADQGAGNYLSYPLYIGARGGTSLRLNGRIYGLVIRFGPILPQASVDRAETFMARRAGVSL